MNKPVAWLHCERPEADVVTDAVKNVWGEAVVGSLAQYSIPLYMEPPESRNKELEAAYELMTSTATSWFDEKEELKSSLESAQEQAGVWKKAYENEAAKFRQETLRTSEQTLLLGEWSAMHKRDHEQGPWSKGCLACDLVTRTRELLLRPINIVSVD